MATGDTTQGRRLPSHEDLEQPGDYWFGNGVLWAILPGTAEMGDWIRLASKGHGQGGEPEWSITEDEDGTVTVDPSIRRHAIAGYCDEWHGFLERGVWREV